MAKERINMGWQSTTIFLVFTYLANAIQVVEKVDFKIKEDATYKETTTEPVLWNPTTDEPLDVQTQTDINPFIGRKINSDNIINDLKNSQYTLENEISQDFPTTVETSIHPCNRKCVLGEPPKLCTYHFKVEWYQTLSKACYDCPYNRTDCGRHHCVPGDGVKRPILVVNRQIPGPAVEVCIHDEILVEVENALLEEGTSVHWHGHHQKGTPFMDGVPFVTQCPIYPKSTFTYRFVRNSK